MPHEHNRKPRPPLDQPALERLALFYAGRYATTRARLRDYLKRKVRERGWDGGEGPDLDGLIQRFSELGYVDDRAFATARAASLGRRGYGERRVRAALQAAGIEEPDAEEAQEQTRDRAWEAALRFAERKRLGPFASRVPERAELDKAFGAMARAGHPAGLIRRLLAARPGEIPEAGRD